MLNGPKKIKFKKTRKGNLKKLEFKSNKLKFGMLGLKSLKSGIITLKQLESARQAISRKTKRKAKIWIKIFTNLPITSKSTGVRMGKGKGNFDHWGAKIRSGTVILEVGGKDVYNMLAALKTGKAKLPIKTKIIKQI